MAGTGPDRTVAAHEPDRTTEGVRGVDLFEYQARDVFEAHGVPVLAGVLARTP